MKTITARPNLASGRLGVGVSGRVLRNAGILALAALVAVGCSKSVAEEKAGAPQMASVERRDLDVRAEAAGLVEPITTVEIKSKASGEVLAVHVETGDEVPTGTLLVEVEPRDVRNAYAQAEADLEVARARAETSGANRKRVEALRKTNVATEQEYEAAVLDEANARAQLVKARTNLELARERLRDVTIRAPMRGTIIERTIEPGGIIASASGTFGGGTVLLKMADLSTVQVRALVDQTDIGKIQPGQQVRVTVEAYPGRPFMGQVVKIEPQAIVDQNVTMFPVLVHLPNADRLLKPGMNTEVEIEIAERQNAIVVPNDAVVSMRDVMTAAVALGLDEDKVREQMQASRGGMRSPAAASAGDGPSDASGRQDVGASVRQGAGAAGREGGEAPNAGASQPDGELSPECSALLAKMRAAGRDALSTEDRTKMRSCFAGRRGAQGGMRASFGGGPGGARGSTRPGVVFVPGPDGPEPRVVTLGVNDWDYTEVVSGLEPGENVFLMTAARLQQQQEEFANRMRQRSSGAMGGLRQQPQQNQNGQQGGGAPRDR